MSDFRALAFRALGLLGGALFVGAQNNIGTGAADQLYQLHCLSCHGADLNGGLGGSLIDDEWKHARTDAEIADLIREGLPDLGMVPYGGTLSEEEIRSLVIYLRERKLLAERDGLTARLAPRDGVFHAADHSFRLEPVTDPVDGILWGMDWLPNGDLLVTERAGPVWLVRDGQRLGPIADTPAVWARGQGGMLEVAVHPDYAANGWIYLGFSESGGTSAGRAVGMTKIVRGRLDGLRWIDEEVIFEVSDSALHTSSGVHFGIRFVFQDGYLFFGIGDRGRMEHAQDLSRPNGKIHRIHDDGRIPADNPFVADPEAFPSIWSYGHRNPQGLVRDPATGVLWETEHGPRGGDEVNHIRPGLNYGWPEVTEGMNYNGQPITHRIAAPGMEPPALSWTPSIAPCGLALHDGTVFPRWRHNLFAGGLSAQELRRLVTQDGKIVHEEIVLKNQGRVRAVASGPDGHLYVSLTDGNPSMGRLYRLVPVD